MLRYLLLLLLVGCLHRNHQPSDTEFNEDERDWVAVYEHEVEVAIQNEDEAAYHFFFRELLVEKVRLYKLKKKQELVK